MLSKSDPKTKLKLTEEEHSLINELKHLYRKLFFLSNTDDTHSKTISGEKMEIEQKPSNKDGL